jgi:hypothetical protein
LARATSLEEHNISCPGAVPETIIVHREWIISMTTLDLMAALSRGTVQPDTPGAVSTLNDFKAEWRASVSGHDPFTGPTPLPKGLAGPAGCLAFKVFTTSGVGWTLAEPSSRRWAAALILPISTILWAEGAEGVTGFLKDASGNVTQG